jgi:Icc-related predicted phosphoesterase
LKQGQNISILHLTDIHGSSGFIDKIGHEISDADLIILAGDITHFGKGNEAGNILELIRNYNKNILAVPGNCDYPEVEEYLSGINISVHRKIIRYNNILMAGLGGSLPCPGKTPFEYTEADAQEWLKDIGASVDADIPFVLISHQPPHGTVNDKLENGKHVGSYAVRDFIRSYHPLLCITGHVHEGICIDSLAGCKIVNPGPFREGRYAMINITGTQITEIKLKQVLTH